MARTVCGMVVTMVSTSSELNVRRFERVAFAQETFGDAGF